MATQDYGLVSSPWELLSKYVRDTTPSLTLTWSQLWSVHLRIYRLTWVRSIRCRFCKSFKDIQYIPLNVHWGEFYPCSQSKDCPWQWRIHDEWRWNLITMVTSSNGSFFCITGPLWGESTGHRWLPFTKACDAELWCFSLICAWTNGWANNGDASDLRCHHAHNDVSVMTTKHEPCA